MLVDYSNSSSEGCSSDDEIKENGEQTLERVLAVSGPDPGSINSPASSCHLVSNEKKNSCCKAELGVSKIPTAAELFRDEEDNTVRPGGNKKESLLKEGRLNLGSMKRKHHHDHHQPPPPLLQQGMQNTKTKGNGCTLLIPQHVARSVSNTVTEDTSSFSDTAQHRRRKNVKRQ